MNLTRRLAATATRTGMIALIGYLFLGMAGGVAAAPRQDSLVLDLLARRTQELMVDRIAQGPSPAKGFELRKIEGRHSLSYNPRHRNFMVWHRCGFGGAANFSAAPRTTKLPVDPLFVLGEGYLKCQSITAMLFEPTVAVEFYPPGYFGDWEYEGLLASDRFEFADEATLESLFKLLVEGVKAPNDDELIEEYLDDDTETELKLAHYRKSTGFSPEFMFEFVGEKLLRVEINLTRGRLLIQAGKKWDGYEIDSRSAWALRTLLEAKRNGRKLEVTAN